MIQRHTMAARRARQKSVSIEPVSFKRIFDRDGMRCHLCLGLVSSSDVSLDHLIPVVRGGAFAEWNLMTAHLSCNQRRGTKPVLFQESRECAETYSGQRLREGLLEGRINEGTQDL
jgi:5-methylcytosine-specific restriction endonuclease McrA